MNLQKRTKKSSKKLFIILLFGLLSLFIFLFFLCRLISTVRSPGAPTTILKINNSLQTCYEKVFTNYKARWNLECKNLPTGFKQDPDRYAIDTGFACSLPDEIAYQLDDFKLTEEADCNLVFDNTN